MTPKEFCEKHNACKSGVDFAMKYETMIDVWDNCHNVNWMIWIMDRMNINMDDKKARLFACWCVQETPLADGRKVWDLLTDGRSRNAVNVALRFAQDEANTFELAAAFSAASAEAFSAASAAASAAAFAAAEAAAFAAAEAAAFSAASAAASAAAFASASAAAFAAAEAAAEAEECAARYVARYVAGYAQAIKFREFFANPFAN